MVTSPCWCKRRPTPSAPAPAAKALPSARCSRWRARILIGPRCWPAARPWACLATANWSRCAFLRASRAKKAAPLCSNWPSAPPTAPTCSPWSACPAWTRPPKAALGSRPWRVLAWAWRLRPSSAPPCPPGSPSAWPRKASAWKPAKPVSAACIFLPTRSRAICSPRTKRFKNSPCSTPRAN